MKTISKFALVGIINTAFSYAIFSACIYLNIYYLAASIVSFLSGTVLSYTLNAKHTFKKSPNSKSAKIYFLSNLLNLGIGLVLLYFFTEFLKITPLVGQLLVIVIRFPLNYLFSAKLVFH